MVVYLEGYAHTLSLIVEGRTTTVAAVDGRIYLNTKQFCCAMHIGGDFNPRHHPAGY